MGEPVKSLNPGIALEALSWRELEGVESWLLEDIEEMRGSMRRSFPSSVMSDVELELFGGDELKEALTLKSPDMESLFGLA